MDIKGASALADFEVIWIVDDNNPCPTLLGIYWATDMNGVINLKKRKMIFDKKSLCVVVPFDPAEGLCYMEPVHDYDNDDDLDYIYKITTQEQYWVNPTFDDQTMYNASMMVTLDSYSRGLNVLALRNCNISAVRDLF